jgi:hypothetical protein
MRSDTIKKGFERAPARRMESLPEYTPRFERGRLVRSARLVTSADLGAILEV